MPSATEQLGLLETARSISLPDALARWHREAEFGELDTGRYRCRYFVWGGGQPLLFVHGMSDQARCFVPVIAHLTNEFRCVAYELPDGDRDGAQLDQIRHADLTADLFALLDHLKCGQTCLYGASFGSTVVLSALHSQPKRFLRAIVQSGFAYRKVAPAEKTLASLARYWPGRMKDLPLRNRLQRRADGPGFAAVVPEIWDFQRANSAATPVRAFAQRARMVAKLDLRPLLPAIQHPILLIAGDNDSVVGRQCTDELAQGLPHADRLEFANCGHYPQYTHAAAVAESARRFLLPPCGLVG